MAPLPAKLKNAAEDAFHDNSLLSLIPPQEREQAAQWYTERAAHFVGTRVELARLYNLERAKFLRGQVSGLQAPHRTSPEKLVSKQETKDNVSLSRR